MFCNWPDCVTSLTFSRWFTRKSSVRRLPCKSSELSVEVFSLSVEVVSSYFCNLKIKIKYLILIRKLSCKSSRRRLTRKSFRILFRDFGHTLVIIEDLCVSHLPEDLHGSRLIKIKYLSFIFNCKSKLKRLTWKSSS